MDPAHHTLQGFDEMRDLTLSQLREKGEKDRGISERNS
jgi:hypothetical protein